jgi:glycine/D-amino acid oxidase-like deaminating enzyme
MILDKSNIEILTDTEVSYFNITNNDGHTKIVSAHTKDSCGNYKEITADKFVLCTNDNSFKTHEQAYPTNIQTRFLPLLQISGLSWTITKQNLNKYNLDHSIYIFDKLNNFINGDYNIFYSKHHNTLRITYGYFIHPDKEQLIKNYTNYLPEFPYYTKLCLKNTPQICDRFVSPDGLPLIGKHKDIDNLYLNTGHGFIGFTLAPFSAIYLKNIMVNKNYMNNILSPQRFNITNFLRFQKIFF